MTGEIPNDWKAAKVCPIYKEGSPLDTSNYRPISLLSVCLKLFEKIVHKQLYLHLATNGLLSTNQSGFRPTHSTVTALIDVTDYILENIDRGLYTGAIFLDLKKAFDTVDVPNLLGKLSSLGVHGTEQLWFKSYLTDRNQCVSIGGETSELNSVQYGVPQGSVLGPLLFIVYVNDIQEQVKQCKITLYADDTAIFFASKDVNQVQAALQEDMKNVHLWLNSNKLTLNVKKTKLMLYGSKKNLATIPSSLGIHIDGGQLETMEIK